MSWRRPVDMRKAAVRWQNNREPRIADDRLATFGHAVRAGAGRRAGALYRAGDGPTRGPAGCRSGAGQNVVFGRDCSL